MTAVGCGVPDWADPPRPLSPIAVAAAVRRWPDATEAALREGRSTFLSHCNTCHDYPDITVIPDERWDGIIGRMGSRAGLNRSQARHLLQFVLAAKQDQPIKDDRMQ